MSRKYPRPSLYAGIALVWLIAATVAAATGRIAALAFPVPQLILAALTLALIASYLGSEGFREWLHSLDLRWLVGVHLVRLLAGSAFIVLGGRGELSPAFALPAGYGDVAVAILALVLLLSGAASTPGRLRLYGIWNWLGLIDLVFVVLNAGRVGRADPGGMLPLLQLPLSLLPTFVVPILLADHFVILHRTRRKGVEGVKA